MNEIAFIVISSWCQRSVCVFCKCVFRCFGLLFGDIVRLDCVLWTSTIASMCKTYLVYVCICAFAHWLHHSYFPSNALHLPYIAVISSHIAYPVNNIHNTENFAKNKLSHNLRSRLNSSLKPNNVNCRQRKSLLKVPVRISYFRNIEKLPLSDKRA